MAAAVVAVQEVVLAAVVVVLAAVVVVRVAVAVVSSEVEAAAVRAGPAPSTAQNRNPSSTFSPKKRRVDPTCLLFVVR